MTAWATVAMTRSSCLKMKRNGRHGWHERGGRKGARGWRRWLLQLLQIRLRLPSSQPKRQGLMMHLPTPLVVATLLLSAPVSMPMPMSQWLMKRRLVKSQKTTATTTTVPTHLTCLLPHHPRPQKLLLERTMTNRPSFEPPMESGRRPEERLVLPALQPMRPIRATMMMPRVITARRLAKLCRYRRLSRPNWKATPEMPQRRSDCGCWASLAREFLALS
mmetsp:Transcript_25036/g.58588  ORF Transcript_25036/g.58588 Transcript_25036/m.58588 type:complete len:219 (+) Transcript_25036:278-934(+)